VLLCIDCLRYDPNTTFEKLWIWLHTPEPLIGFGLEDQVLGLGLGQCVLDANPDVNIGWFDAEVGLREKLPRLQ